MPRQSDFFSYAFSHSCFTDLILKIASPTASISWSLFSSNDSTYRHDRKFSVLLGFRSKALTPDPILQGHAIASKRDGEVFAQKQLYRNHQGKTAMQLSQFMKP